MQFWPPETSSKITSRLIFDTLNHTTPLSVDALENYSNISITPTFTSGDYRAAFDLSPMPLNTVKVAGTKYSSNGYVPSNLVINQGCVLGRKVGLNISSLGQADLREILGIKSISNDSYDKIREIIDFKLDNILSVSIMLKNNDNTPRETFMVKDLKKSLNLLDYNITE